MNDKSWQIAYNTGYELRRKGITVPTIDIIIASIAESYDCLLLHHDKHLKIIADYLGLTSIDFIENR
ncbi:MAG: hypothetical protein N2380_06980 [bacterium]|nr:hypothetical protein [bacterium]